MALLATLALPLGPLLKSMWPLKAYAIDIIGSMSGIAAFAVLSALGTDPLVWFTVSAVLVVLVDVGRNRLRWVAANTAVLGAVVLLVAASARPGEVWSPYYRIDSFRDSSGLEHITVDGIPHQALHPLGRAGLEDRGDVILAQCPVEVLDVSSDLLGHGAKSLGAFRGVLDVANPLIGEVSKHKVGSHVKSPSDRYDRNERFRSRGV